VYINSEKIYALGKIVCPANYDNDSNVQIGATQDRPHSYPTREGAEQSCRFFLVPPLDQIPFS